MMRTMQELMGVPLEERTREELLEQVRRLQGRIGDLRKEHNGAIKALQKRLHAHRKAKASANRRADTACAAMRAMIEKFENSMEEQPTGEEK